VTPIRRIFRPDEKAEAVRMADEAGNDRQIQLQLNLAQGIIGRWRREGYGRRMETGSTGSPIERATNSRTEHPCLRCPACSRLFEIPGEATNLNRLRAWERHYEDSPECLEANKRRIA
jgi:transposase-like protein